ncbi:hypothetical protein GGI20_002828 [Coemansia sp. BCRC 34301]|nr:hypothetical protein GGI20_002828 [Coemansia sp. BCRC 34301]
MSNSARAPLLFVKLPRSVVERLQTASPDGTQLVIGGKERILTGTLTIGASRYDVRYSAERSGAPPLLFQGGPPQPASSEGWTNWTQRGKLMGKLTVVHKGRLPGAAATTNPAATNNISKLPTTATKHPDEALLSALHAQASSTTAKSPPQKKSGIVRQNRELLRDRAMHILAEAPTDELELIERLKSTNNVVLDVLAAIGKKTGTAWSLYPEQYKHVQIETWPHYSAQARQKVLSNALSAFDVLGLATDSPERRRALDLQSRLSNFAGSACSVSVSASSAALLKSPSVPSISLPKDTPPSKKKPVRSVIAPTLAKKPKVESGGEVKRILGTAPASLSAAAAMKAADNGSSASVADPGAREPPWLAGRPARPVPALAQKPKGGRPIDDVNELPRAVPESMDSWDHTGKASPEHRRLGNVSYSVPVTATADYASASGFRASPPRPELESSPHLPQSRLSARHSGQHRRQRGLSDSNNKMLDTEPAYRRQQWAADASSLPANRNGRSRSRSNSGSLRGPRPNNLAAAAPIEGEHGDGDKMLQHVPVRSRPLRAQVLAIQEKLVKSLAEERAPAISAVASSHDGQSAAKPLRGPSLSPTEDHNLPLTPSPIPKIDHVETFEELRQLQAQLTMAYAEYSQLRLKIDYHCAEFAPLIDELDSARAAYSDAAGAALLKRTSSEADREEGEEVPDDASVACALAMAIDPTTEKCAPDGCRLYWAETESGAWLADSADAVIGSCADGDLRPALMRKLLPEEARVLLANQTIVERYRELDSDDVRLWVKRYLRLHATIEQMSVEMNKAHARITNDLLSQFDALRDDMGDGVVDEAIAEAGGDSDRAGTSSSFHRLTIDAHRDDIAAMGPTV